MISNKAVFGLVAFAVALPAQTISDADRKVAAEALRSSGALFLRSIGGLSEAQWKFKAAPDRWSIAECAEHLAVTDPAMLAWIRTVLARPAGKAVAPSDQSVLAKSVDRSKKEKAPKSITPTGKLPTPAEVVATFRKNREETIRYVETTQDALRSHFTTSATEPMDAFQWVLTIAGHTERHVAQINEVKAAAGYPGK